MQVFLPHDTFRQSVAVLDRLRLQNQIYRECKTLICGGWKNHPAAKMWAPYRWQLCAYALTGIREMRKRRMYLPSHPFFCNWDPNKLSAYESWLYGKMTEIQREGEGEGVNQPPHFLGNFMLHASHRSQLLRKDPEWYGQFNWREAPGEFEYLWPIDAPPHQSTTMSNIVTPAYETVFVYGTLRYGFGLNRVLLEGQSKFLGLGILTRYAMHDLGPFPYIIGTGNDAHSVVGELYSITPDVLELLDTIEGYRPGTLVRHYNRVMVDVRSPSDDRSFTPAWVYVYDRHPDKRPHRWIESGDFTFDRIALRQEAGDADARRVYAQRIERCTEAFNGRLA